MNILITGSNGFIGYNLAKSLASSHYIIGVDNDSSSDWVKKIRSTDKQVHKFYNVSINDTRFLSNIMKENAVDIVIHLAAKTGVRKSFDDKYDYVDTNINGFLSVLDSMIKANVKKMIFASSSSVYGNSAVTKEMSQESLYAITKFTDEMIARLYSVQYGLDIVGIRPFTVYGEYGRTDMAPLIWVEQLINGEDVTLFGDGSAARDFTYVGDVVDAIVKIIDHGFTGNTIYDVGCGTTHTIIEFVNSLATALNKKFKISFSDMPKQDVVLTKSNSNSFEEVYGKLKHTQINDGIYRFVKWIECNESNRVNDIVP